jgi:alanyl-tRNA synthetase
LKAAEIRESFLSYFEKHDHRRVPSASVIPHDDPTLLFINAGMNQFKDVFLGQRSVPYKRATTVQKCLRAGGKHNDLENVGETVRHQTFFEMLGNFSFGDYFKEEAIYYGWDWVHRVLKLPVDRLYATVYNEDDEAFALWEKIAPELKNGHILRFDEHDNFWSMGETGPCGPCSEIHFDRGPEAGSGPEDILNGEGDRYVEIWNLVFMQFDRDKDGNMKPLPKPSVDTGAGLERISMVVQGVNSNYESDLFVPLIHAIEELTGKEYFQDRRGLSHRVIADHIRALSFAIADGAIPSNEGRGYVLRRILRRAARHARLLGSEEPLIYKLTSTLVDVMGHAYPELKTQADHVALVVKSEEENFGQTLDRGIDLFEQVVAEVREGGGETIPGEEVFKLYDTYGFPVDLTEVMAREKGMDVDMAGFEAALAKQRERSRDSASFDAPELIVKNQKPTEFVGYNDNFSAEAQIQQCSYVTTSDGTYLQVVLDKTPFYAESGGQVGDTGILRGKNTQYKVVDTRKQGDISVHYVAAARLKDPEMPQGTVEAIVDDKRQKATQRNHTATHLLHKALRDVLGEHVQQAGSLVAPDRFRFDFSHFKQVTDAELREIEKRVNEQILANKKVSWKVIPIDEARKEGAMMLFGEKYGDEVRMVSVEGYSRELCGGTHVQATGEIGLFVIASESAIAAGMRRIEALTGEGALEYLNQKRHQFDQAMQMLKVPAESVIDKLEELLAENKRLKKELDKAQSQQAVSSVSDLFAKAHSVNGIKVLVNMFGSRDELNAFADYTQTMKEPALGIFYSESNQYAVTSSQAAIKQGFSARAVINHLNKQFEGRGGGREHFTQGGTTQPLNEQKLLESVTELLKGNKE